MKKVVAPALAALMLAGCTLGTLPVPGPSIQTVDRITAAGLPPLALGGFASAPDIARDDKGIPIRASTIRPAGGSFAHYLADTLASQLRIAGKLDQSSHLIVSATLIRNRANSAVGKAHAELAAEFVLTRYGHIAYRKTLSVERSWDSSFIGAQAIPAAEANYSALYPALVEKLISDADFAAATHAP